MIVGYIPGDELRERIETLVADCADTDRKWDPHADPKLPSAKAWALCELAKAHPLVFVNLAARARDLETRLDEVRAERDELQAVLRDRLRYVSRGHVIRERVRARSVKP